MSEELIKKEIANIYKDTYNESIPNSFYTTNNEGNIEIYPHTYDLMKMLGFSIETTGHEIILSEPARYVALLDAYKAKNTMNLREVMEFIEGSGKPLKVISSKHDPNLNITPFVPHLSIIEKEDHIEVNIY